MNLSISATKRDEIFGRLSNANKAFNAIYKGDRIERQPIHTVYQGADLFEENVIANLGQEAIKTLELYAPNWIVFGKAFKLNGFENLPDDAIEIENLIGSFNNYNSSEIKQHEFGFIYNIYQKVQQKLQTEPVEDYRIDFEDGFGNKTNQQEDETAIFVANELYKSWQKKSLPYFIGIRTKPFTEELKERSIRTIDLLLTTLLTKTDGVLPNNFVIMLPKVTIPEQVEALSELLDILEEHFHLPHNSIAIEMMVETTQAVMDDTGKNPLLKFVQASNGRCHAMHFGTYDYTASCGITAAYQEMDHPVCDFAHHVTKVALAHTGIWLSDGATNTLPNGPYNIETLTSEQYQENVKVVHAAWSKGYQNIRHSLWNGFYQGWDLFASQLPMRYTAVYAFFLESYESAVQRMKSFLEKSTTVSQNEGFVDIAEDAATGQALLNYFLKALNSGAISMEEAMVTGLSKEEIESRSFAAILKNRMRA